MGFRSFKKQILQISLLCGMFSCDPGVQYERVIQNDSDFALTVFQFAPKNQCRYNPKDTIVIEPHASAIIGQYDYIGRTKEFDDCNSCVDSFKVNIRNYPERKLVIDLNEASNWQFKVIKKGLNGSGKCECRLILGNDMIK